LFNLFHQTLSVRDKSLRLHVGPQYRKYTVNHVNIFVESWKFESNSAHQATFWLVLILTQYIGLCWNVPLLWVHKFWTFHKIVQRNSQKCFHPPENKRSPANDWEWSTLTKIITLPLALKQHTPLISYFQHLTLFARTCIVAFFSKFTTCDFTWFRAWFKHCLNLTRYTGDSFNWGCREKNNQASICWKWLAVWYISGAMGVVWFDVNTMHNRWQGLNKWHGAILVICLIVCYNFPIYKIIYLQKINV